MIKQQLFWQIMKTKTRECIITKYICICFLCITYYTLPIWNDFEYLESSIFTLQKGDDEMGYCFVTTEKITTLGALTAKYNHNYRMVQVDNADPTLKHLNDEILPLPTDENGKKMDYVDFFKKRIEEQDYYKDHSIRKNNVLAIEVVATFSRQDNIPIDEWKEKNVEWIKETFNKASDGKNNVASIVFHGDENGNVHCHAIVIPINENGRLGARSYTGGSRTLRDMQTSYAKAMKEFGLERGLEGGQARHKDIKKYYADLNNALQVPEPGASESAIAYHNRVLESVQTLQAAAMRRRDEEYAKHQRRMAMERLEQRKTLAREMETSKKMQEVKARQELKEIEKTIAAEQKKINELVIQCERLKRDMNFLKQYGNPDLLVEKAKLYDELQETIDNLHYRRPEKYETLKADLEDMKDTLEKEKEQNIEL